MSLVFVQAMSFYPHKSSTTRPWDISNLWWNKIYITFLVGVKKILYTNKGNFLLSVYLTFLCSGYQRIMIPFMWRRLGIVHVMNLAAHIDSVLFRARRATGSIREWRKCEKSVEMKSVTNRVLHLSARFNSHPRYNPNLNKMSSMSPGRGNLFWLRPPPLWFH